ncbi:TetR/AcrR family transcriptional regulator [Streptomyces sp. NPDC051018]|uniref:TetR/AcrR family transcriptional regulator n=1 Tax=Streptomyces sp. NPDC051018 TaxID=3365639 RepID=UPI003788064D
MSDNDGGNTDPHSGPSPGSRGDLQAMPPPADPPRQRADAVRNRARVLAAAEQLFTAHDPHTVTMDQIAKAAGVGRGTLYRSFSDRSAVAIALLDEHERRLQGQMIYGPPPLGPGAPPAERLAAFYLASLDLLERHLPLALGTETGPARYLTGSYGFWRLHVRTLLQAGGAPDPDALADVALGPLAPGLYQHQRHTLGISHERVAEALCLLARRLLPSARP